jgi:hypothetical protein
MHRIAIITFILNVLPFVTDQAPYGKCSENAARGENLAAPRRPAIQAAAIDITSLFGDELPSSKQQIP